MSDPVRTSLARYEGRLLADLSAARQDRIAADRRARQLEEEIALVRGALASRARAPEAVSPTRRAEQSDV